MADLDRTPARVQCALGAEALARPSAPATESSRRARGLARRGTATAAHCQRRHHAKVCRARHTDPRVRDGAAGLQPRLAGGLAAVRCRGWWHCAGLPGARHCRSWRARCSNCAKRWRETARPPLRASSRPGVARARRCQRRNAAVATGRRLPLAHLPARGRIDDTRVELRLQPLQIPKPAQVHLRRPGDGRAVCQLVKGFLHHQNELSSQMRTGLGDINSAVAHQPPGRAAPGAVTRPCRLAGALCPSLGPRG